MAKEMTLADHAAAWAVERNEDVPQRGTAAFRTLYLRWHAFAFANFRDDLEEHTLSKVCIRENVMSGARYLNAKGQWGPWGEARRFAAGDAAELFAARYGIETYGLFAAPLTDDV